MSKRRLLSAIFIVLTLCLSCAVLYLSARSGSQGSDIRNLTAGSRNLLSGNPPSAKNLSLYPAFNYLLYFYLGLIPQKVLVPLTQCAALLLILLSLKAWGGKESTLRNPGILLILSVPVLQLLYIDQLNTAVAFASMTVALHGINRRWWWLAGAGALISLVCRPLNAIVILPGLFFLVPRKGYLLSLLYGAILGIILTVATWMWDRNFLHALLHSSHTRPLVGPIGYFREAFGLHGLVVYVLAVAVCAVLIGYSTRQLDIWDSAAILFAFSLLTVHLGGQYVALYEIPAVYRLAYRWNRKWILGAYIGGYGICNIIYGTLGAHFAVLGPVSIPWIMMPLIAGLLVLIVLVRAAEHSSRTPTPGALP